MVWNEESTDKTRESDKEEPDMPSQEADEEEVREGKAIKILTPNKLLTRLSILLEQIKAGDNSYKLKMTSDKYCIFCISILKSPKIFTTI